PLGNGVTGKEGHSTRGEYGIPIIYRLFHAFLLLDGIANLVAIVLNTIGNGGPTVVFAGLNAVNLIAATGAKLTVPEVAGNGMECQALYIAMAVRIDFRTRAAPSSKRIARRRLPCRGDAQNFTKCGVQILGQWPGYDI